jgi:hypothetical protein
MKCLTLHAHWAEAIFALDKKLFSVDEEIAQLLARSLGSEQSLGLTPLH